MKVSRQLVGESGALLAGSLMNGLAAYGFIALGTRLLGAAAFSPVAIVWVFWAFSAALLTFPIQHWVIRQGALDGHLGGVRMALGRVVRLAGVVAAGEGVVAALWRERLFGEGNWAWPLVVVMVAVGAAFLGLVRGVLAGSGRYGAAAGVIGGENLLRLAVGAALLGLGGGPLSLAAALAAGPAVALAFPGAWRLGARSTERASTGLVGAAGLSVLLAQVVLNSGPPLVSSLGGVEREVTALFTALAVFRAPYLVALGLSVRATYPLTRLVEERGRSGLRGPAWATLSGSLAAAALAFAVARPWGPPLIRALFGAGTDLPGTPTGLIAAGCVVALGGLALTVMLIAASARVALVGSWVLGTVVGVAMLVWGASLGPVDRVVVAFVGAEAAALVAAATALSASGATSRRVGGRSGSRDGRSTVEGGGPPG